MKKTSFLILFCLLFSCKETPEVSIKLLKENLESTQYPVFINHNHKDIPENSTRIDSIIIEDNKAIITYISELNIEKEKLTQEHMEYLKNSEYKLKEDGINMMRNKSETFYKRLKNANIQIKYFVRDKNGIEFYNYTISPNEL